MLFKTLRNIPPSKHEKYSIHFKSSHKITTISFPKRLFSNIAISYPGLTLYQSITVNVAQQASPVLLINI